MGSRAAHNWKRRQKLLEKYGGKGGGKDNSKGKGKGKTGRKVAERSQTKKKAPGDSSKKAPDKVSKAKIVKKRKSDSDQSAPQDTKKRKVKIKVAGKKVKLKKLVSGDKTGKGKTLKTKKLRKVSKKSFQKQTARVVCPGSLTERFVACGRATSHSALTAFERGLLATGPLSWRWLREQDEDLLPPKMRPVEADHEGHSQALREACRLKSAKDAERLQGLDAMLETDGLWPRCPARVTVADRLQSPKGLKRRCERYLKEAIVPLADELVLKTASAESSSSQALKQAHQLVTSCAHAWREAAWTQEPAEASSAKMLHRAWLHMLHRSLAGKDEEHVPGPWQSWLATLRQVQLARLCPCLDTEAQTRLLRSIALSSPAMQQEVDSAPVVIPLGLFTFWQGLVLVALARRQGRHALVVRRHAAGAPEVLFRTSSVVLSATG